MKRFASLLIVLGAVAMLAGCAVRLGKGDEPPRFEWAGLGSVYVGASGIRPYDDGSILRADVLKFDRGGEIVSLEVWPVFGLGIGLVGARVQVLAVEAAAGVILYHPEAREAYRGRDHDTRDRDKERDRAADRERERDRERQKDRE